MSARLLSLAFDAEAPSASAKLVLIKLVDCCDDEGKKIFPAVATLARAAQCDPRTVQRHIAMFCTVGLLRKVRDGGAGRGSTTHYEMNLDVLRRIGAKGWAAVAGTVIAGANDDDEPGGEACTGPESHAETAEPEAAETAKGDTMSPYPEPLRVTPATVKGDTGVTQPLNRIPQESERERVSAGRAGAPSTAGGEPAANAGLPRDGEPAPDGQPIPQLAEFVKRWPTSVADSQVKVASAWAELGLAERREAIAEIDRFLAELKRQKRSHVPGGFTYLTERKWRLLPQMQREASAGQLVTVKPFSKAWWALFHHARAGRGGNAKLLLQVAEQGRDWAVRQADLDAAGPDALKAAPANGEAGQAFFAGCARAGFHFRKFGDAAWVFLPVGQEQAAAVDQLKAGGL